MNLFTRPDAPRMRPLEIAASYLSRLAAWLRYRDAAQFCLDFDLDFDAVSAGDGGQLQKLSDLTSTPVEDLSHGPVRERRRFRIEGELLSTAYLDRVDLWICPDCAAEDMAAAPHLAPEAAIAVRRDFIVSAICSCAQHRRRLVKVGRSEWKRGRHDTSLITMDVAMRIEGLQALSPIVDLSPMDVFVRERFAGKLQGYHLLDPMPLNQVIKLCGPFGNWLLTGGKVKIRYLQRDALNHYLSVGLQILAGGKDTIAQAIEQRCRDEKGLPVQRMMDYIGDVLCEDLDDPSIKTVHETLVEACREDRKKTCSNLCPCRHTADPGARQPDRLWYCLPSATDRYKSGTKLTEAFARAAGALHDFNGVPHVDARMLDHWIQKDGGLVPAWKIAREIGATPNQIDALIIDNLLVPAVARPGTKNSYDWLRPDHVDSVMKAMLHYAEAVDTPPLDMVTINQMQQRIQGALRPVNRALAAGTIKIARLAGEKPYASILVDIEDVLALLGHDGDRGPDFVHIEDFAKASGVKVAAAYYLSARGLIQSEMRINPANGRTRRMVPKAEIDRFATSYVTALRLATALGMSRKEITAAMAKKGIEPVDSGSAPIRLFRMDEVAHLLPA